MVRTAQILIPLALVGLCAAGCENEQKTRQTTTEPSAATDLSTRHEKPPAEETVDAGSIPGRVHVVQPKDTLVKLSQRYYGSPKSWRKIWEANRRRISDPNNLPVGRKLIIP